ncbi:hypothetical protein T03_15242 [Trichinella britovi]|uniref:Uncharacterized protein n=2 Tax=Trichinella TaxID=6333 RepID=A0A0V1CYC5_TRIBR|nr:hypothetical protein T12_4231 [Trichinella patagoniensis]KRY54256.1 hypothetical protein T03_15242 [Trichinella britovi]
MDCHLGAENHKALELLHQHNLVRQPYLMRHLPTDRKAILCAVWLQIKGSVTTDAITATVLTTTPMKATLRMWRCCSARSFSSIFNFFTNRQWTGELKQRAPFYSVQKWFTGAKRFVDRFRFCPPAMTRFL